MTPLLTIIRKELVDLARDRRTVALALITGPLLTAVMSQGIGLAMAERFSADDELITVEAIGADRAPNLMAFLRSHNIALTASQPDPERAIREERAELILRFDPEYDAHWRASEPVFVELIHDGTRKKPAELAERVGRALGRYDKEVGVGRLLARGIDPTVMQAVAVSERDLATPKSKANRLLWFLPFTLMMVVFLSGAPSAVDGTAGEKERQSLEPLLTNPVSPAVVMSGKIIATSVFTTCMLSATLVLLELGFLVSDSAAAVSPAAMALIGLSMMPLVFVASSLITFLAAGSKSVKEAQSSIAGITMLPMLVMVLSLHPPKKALWVSVAPLVSQNQVIEKLVRGETLSALDWALTVAPTLAVAGVFWWWAARRSRDEAFIVSS
jgi:sodium transport system permease protein